MNAVSPDLAIKAQKAQANSYAPFSKFCVGVALSSDKGEFVGTNVEVVHFKSTCAEAGAISAMVTGGGRLIKDLVIVGPNDALCAPCGDCRQRIYEFADKNTRVHSFTKDLRLMKSYSVAELLPDAFGPDDLK